MAGLDRVAPAGQEEDLYSILGVSKDADVDTIKRAYKKLALANHPDKNLGDEAATQRFQQIGHAYSVLSDEKKRARYDRTGEADYEEIDFDALLQTVLQEWTQEGGMVDELFAAEGDMLEEDIKHNWEQKVLVTEKGKLRCTLCGLSGKASKARRQ